MAKVRRAHIPKSVETEILFASRRRCCLCFYVDEIDEEVNGQIAHLNKDARDSRFTNLVWLCVDHHDKYDTRRSQTKGYTPAEISRYRDRLYAHNKVTLKALAKRASQVSELRPGGKAVATGGTRRRVSSRHKYFSTPWKPPLWLEVDRPTLFAFKALNGVDGVCLIERIDLPDGRIVVACMEVSGNPGSSITNSAEYICDQVCQTFEIEPQKLVWLEHYDIFGEDEWKLVSFGVVPPEGEFSDPIWTTISPVIWRGLWLKPKKKLKVTFGSYDSKLKKLFPWPPE